jgi:hypothetical protein
LLGAEALQAREHVGRSERALERELRPCRDGFALFFALAERDDRVKRDAVGVDSPQKVERARHGRVQDGQAGHVAARFGARGVADRHDRKAFFFQLAQQAAYLRPGLQQHEHGLIRQLEHATVGFVPREFVGVQRRREHRLRGAFGRALHRGASHGYLHEYGRQPLDVRVCFGVSL